MSSQLEYTPMADYDGAWMFEDLPLSELAMVRPLTKQSSSELWARFVSGENRHPMLLAGDEWPSQAATWQQRGHWSRTGSELPELLRRMPWADEDLVYFAAMSERVTETPWGVFKKHWQDFVLYENEGPLLIHPLRLEVAAFGPNGDVRVGVRPMAREV